MLAGYVAPPELKSGSSIALHKRLPLRNAGLHFTKFGDQRSAGRILFSVRRNGTMDGVRITVRVVQYPAMMPAPYARAWLCAVVSGAIVWLDGTPQRLSRTDMLHLERACVDYAARCMRDDEARCYAQVWDADERRHVFFEIADR